MMRRTPGGGGLAQGGRNSGCAVLPPAGGRGDTRHAMEVPAQPTRTPPPPRSSHPCTLTGIGHRLVWPHRPLLETVCCVDTASASSPLIVTHECIDRTQWPSPTVAHLRWAPRRPAPVVAQQMQLEPPPPFRAPHKRTDAHPPPTCVGHRAGQRQQQDVERGGRQEGAVGGDGARGDRLGRVVECIQFPVEVAAKRKGKQRLASQESLIQRRVRLVQPHLSVDACMRQQRRRNKAAAAAAPAQQQQRHMRRPQHSAQQQQRQQQRQQQQAAAAAAAATTSSGSDASSRRSYSLIAQDAMATPLLARHMNHTAPQGWGAASAEQVRPAKRSEGVAEGPPAAPCGSSCLAVALATARGRWCHAPGTVRLPGKTAGWLPLLLSPHWLAGWQRPEEMLTHL